MEAVLKTDGSALVQKVSCFVRIDMLVAVMNYKRAPEQYALEGARQIYQCRYHAREVIPINDQDSAHKFGVY